MKSRYIKQYIRNRLLFALPVLTGLVYGAWRLVLGAGRVVLSSGSVSADSEKSLRMKNIPIPPLVGFIIYLVIAVTFPLLITGVALYFILREAKVESSVDYLTYIDQTALKEFEWSEDPLSHMIGYAERKKARQINGLRPSPDAPVENIRVDPIAAASLHDDLSDLPDYDPNGPSPFKKA